MQRGAIPLFLNGKNSNNMLKGTIGLIVIAIIVWVYLITFHKLFSNWFNKIFKND